MTQGQCVVGLCMFEEQTESLKLTQGSESEWFQPWNPHHDKKCFCFIFLFKKTFLFFSISNFMYVVRRYGAGEGVNKLSSGYKRGLSCVNDDAMIGIGNDYSVDISNTNPGGMSDWAHDVSVFSPENCDGGRASKMMGTDITLSPSIASYSTTEETYTYTIWTRTSYIKPAGVGVRNTEATPAGSCKDAVSKGVGGEQVWIKPGSASAAFLAGCNLDLAGGGWTLLLTQTDPAANFQGSINPFVDYGNVGVPSTAEPYTRVWANTFLPSAGDEFMIVKVRFLCVHNGFLFFFQIFGWTQSRAHALKSAHHL